MKCFHDMLTFQKLKEAFHYVCKSWDFSGPITWLADSSYDGFLVDRLVEKISQLTNQATTAN